MRLSAKNGGDSPLASRAFRNIGLISPYFGNDTSTISRLIADWGQKPITPRSPFLKLGTRLSRYSLSAFHANLEARNKSVGGNA
jgi:hypothetical protein